MHISIIQVKIQDTSATLSPHVPFVLTVGSLPSPGRVSHRSAFRLDLAFHNYDHKLGPPRVCCLNFPVLLLI